MRPTLVLIVFIALFGCADEEANHDTTPTVVRTAVLPDQARDRLIAKYEPLIEYLEKTTGLDFELSIPGSYSELVERFDEGSIDLAWFGGLTYMQASQKSRAVAVAFRDVDLEFTSCYLAKSTDPRKTITDFAGEPFSFGPRLSTSGHLMPRHFMTEEGLDPEKFFGPVRYSAGHDQTARWVSDGTVVLGVGNCVIVRSLMKSGEPGSDDLRIVETTPPYPDYVWASHTSMDRSTRQKLLDALLGLDPTIAEHREVLRSQGANAYLPAGRSDFELVRTAAVKAGVLEGPDQ